MRQGWSRGAWGAGALCLVGLLGLAGRGLAAGPPLLQGYPLAYQGQAFVDGVAAANQSLLVTLTLFLDHDILTDSLCSTQATVQTDGEGRFQLILDPLCGPALTASPTAWVELQVGSQAPLGRTQLGAVPYAAQAAHASTAEAATFGDDLLPGSTLGYQLDERLPAVRLLNGQAYSNEALYVGPLPEDAQGNLGTGLHGGYAAVQQQCSQLYGAGAHLCTAQEMLRSETLGRAESVGGDPDYGHNSTAWLAGAVVSDCLGFTAADHGHVGLTWDFSTGTGAFGFCDGHNSVPCCQ